MTHAPSLEADLSTPPQVAWPTVALTGLVAACALAGAFAAASERLALASGCVFVAGWCGFTVLHEAAHGNVCRARWANALAGELAASVLLCRFLAFRQIHQRHHRFTNDPARDPDRFSGDGPAWQRPLRLAVTDLHYYFEFEPRALRSSRAESALSNVSAVGLLATLAALLATGHGWAVLVAWALPIRLSMFFAALFVDYVPHMRPHAPSRSEHALAHTAQIAPSLVADALTLCHSHHLLHHLWPRVPFYRLPEVWRRHGDALRARGAQVRWG